MKQLMDIQYVDSHESVVIGFCMKLIEALSELLHFTARTVNAITAQTNLFL